MYHVLEWASQCEVLAFHWQPWQRGGERAPHLHAHSPLLHERIARTIHVSTGQVLLPDIVRFLITELDVEPRRPDWEAALASADSALRAAVVTA